MNAVVVDPCRRLSESDFSPPFCCRQKHHRLWNCNSPSTMELAGRRQAFQRSRGLTCRSPLPLSDPMNRYHRPSRISRCVVCAAFLWAAYSQQAIGCCCTKPATTAAPSPCQQQALREAKRKHADSLAQAYPASYFAMATPRERNERNANLPVAHVSGGGIENLRDLSSSAR